MSDNTEPVPRQSAPAKAAGKPGYTVPIRPDGWPDLPGRRPMSSTGRAKIREAIEAGLPDSALTAPGPFPCYLTIGGPAASPARGRRPGCAAGSTPPPAPPPDNARPATTPPTPPSPSQLRRELDKLAARHGWTLRDTPR